MVSSKSKPDYDVDRGYNLTLYSLRGGPINPLAVKELNKAAEEIARKYDDLAISGVLVKR